MNQDPTVLFVRTYNKVPLLCGIRARLDELLAQGIKGKGSDHHIPSKERISEGGISHCSIRTAKPGLTIEPAL